VALGDDEFREDATGLDHLSFSVDDLAALEAAVGVLDELGIAHEGIKDLGGAGIAILEFRDPDNIALELTAPTG
jgi:glyoxylase I family protein